MTGHGSKLNRKIQAAVLALLTARNSEEAARSIGVSQKTFQRWQKLPEFEQALREAQTAAFRQSLGKLHQASTAAVTTLLKTMVDPATPLAAKARCAFYILDQTRRAIETDNILPRLEELERATETTEKRKS
jgi:hypothetical protein